MKLQEFSTDVTLSSNVDSMSQPHFYFCAGTWRVLRSFTYIIFRRTSQRTFCMTQRRVPSCKYTMRTSTISTTSLCPPMTASISS